MDASAEPARELLRRPAIIVDFAASLRDLAAILSEELIGAALVREERARRAPTSTAVRQVGKDGAGCLIGSSTFDVMLDEPGARATAGAVVLLTISPEDGRVAELPVVRIRYGSR